MNLFFRVFDWLFKAYLKKNNPTKWAKKLGVNVGSNTSISSTVQFPTEAYLVTIGSNCAITSYVMIHTHGGGRVARREIPDFDCFGKVIIEDWVYIGSGAQIMPGVTIGEGALVAAGSVVTKSVPSGMVVGGNPARIICSVADYIDKNVRYNIGTKGLDDKKKKKILMTLPNEKFIKK